MQTINHKIIFPHLGLRILKSAGAVLCCFLFYDLFRPEGIIFYSQLSALWCIETQRVNTLHKAGQRTVGTMIGCLFGLFVLLINMKFITDGRIGDFIYAGLVSVCIIFVLYITVMINRKDASYFSCVVFLSIVVMHIGDEEPFLFVFNRFLDTMIGIIIAMIINNLHFPRQRRKDILFVSGMDDTLLSVNEQMSPYNRVEINRMIAEGANFTVATRRTPASLIEPLRDINIKLPVIAMDGAVMYDIKKNEFLNVYVIADHTAQKIREFLNGYHVNCFINMLLDNTLLIQYEELKNEAEKKMYNTLYTSPYRNYITRDMLSQCKCIYFMLLQEKTLCEKIYNQFLESELSEKVKIIMYDSIDYKGYSYIKIYNKNASRENMLDYLIKKTGLKKAVTFGSIAGKYDVVIEEYNNNKVAHTLKKMYEPLIGSIGFHKNKDK